MFDWDYNMYKIMSVRIYMIKTRTNVTKEKKRDGS